MRGFGGLGLRSGPRSVWGNESGPMFIADTTSTTSALRVTNLHFGLRHKIAAISDLRLFAVNLNRANPHSSISRDLAADRSDKRSNKY